MNPEEFYGSGEKSSLKDTQKRELIHSAYWRGIGLAKDLGCPETTAADNRALELAFVDGFIRTRETQKNGGVQA